MFKDNRTDSESIRPLSGQGNGLGRGGRAGGGRGRGGRAGGGRGWRHWFHATGLTGMQREAYGWAESEQPAPSGSLVGATPGRQNDQALEIGALKDQARHLDKALDGINKRISELEKLSTEFDEPKSP